MVPRIDFVTPKPARQIARETANKVRRQAGLVRLAGETRHAGCADSDGHGLAPRNLYAATVRLRGLPVGGIASRRESEHPVLSPAIPGARMLPDKCRVAIQPAHDLPRHWRMMPGPANTRPIQACARAIERSHLVREYLPSRLCPAGCVALRCHTMILRCGVDGCAPILCATIPGPVPCVLPVTLASLAGRASHGPVALPALCKPPSPAPSPRSLALVR